MFKYTRIHEPRHLHPEISNREDKTVIFYETSKNDSENPYYPINTDLNVNLFKKYKKLVKDDKNLIIGGRLGEYVYYNMDKTIPAALKWYEMEIKRHK